jgi:hypothetical protein
MSFRVPEKHRIRTGPLASDELNVNNGFFVFKKDGVEYRCMVSDGLDWEHVSISLNKQRSPDWEEMCMIKNIFWEESDCVVQYHPSKSDYVSFHEFCLHLWRPTKEHLPKPNPLMVGPK